MTGAIVLFGVGETIAVFLIFLAAFFPIVLACIAAVSNDPAIFRHAGRNFGLAPVQLLAKVIFPAALPQIIGGLRIALGISWVVVVAAEMIAIESGLGYLAIDARNPGKRYDLVVAAMLLIGAIGLALDLCFRSVRNGRAACPVTDCISRLSENGEIFLPRLFQGFPEIKEALISNRMQARAQGAWRAD